MSKKHGDVQVQSKPNPRHRVQSIHFSICACSSGDEPPMSSGRCRPVVVESRMTGMSR